MKELIEWVRDNLEAYVSEWNSVADTFESEGGGYDVGFRDGTRKAAEELSEFLGLVEWHRAKEDEK